ncbi:MAG: transposase [Cyclobacteriaceae bacterium]|jgi:transposase
MAKNMELVINESFPESQIFTDRFHVVKLAMNAVQHVSIKQR